jgi:hypothetical protein
MFWLFASLPLLLLTIGSWVLTGLAIVRGLFRVTSGLTAFTLALPIGMVAQLIIVNFGARLIFLPISTWAVVIGSALISLFILSRPRPALIWEISLQMRLVLLVMLAALSLVVTYIHVREVFGDDPGHASMIQLMAAGEFPLQFQCNPNIRASYGYGGDLLSSITEVMSGTTSWEAMDVVKVASVISVTMLSFLVGWRYKNKVGAGLLSVFLIFTVGTMLWVFLPLSTAGGRYIADQSSALSPIPAQMDSMVATPWNFSVVPPGFVTTNYSHAQRTISWGFAPFAILLFLAVLETHMDRFTKSITLGILISTAGILHPAVLSILLPGFVGYTAISFTSKRIRNNLFQFPQVDFNLIIALGVVIVVLAIQGGPITDTILDKLNGIANMTTSFTLSAFNLPSCRNGVASLNCAMLSVGNVGLAPFLIPLLLWVAWRVSKSSAWLILLLGCIAAIGITIFTSYGYEDWNIQRLITFSSWSVAVLLGPILYDYFTRPGLVGKAIVSGAVVLISYTGLVEALTIIDGRNLRDSNTYDFSPMVDPLELSMMKYGADLPLDARFFDPSGCSDITAARPAYLFGRYELVSVSRTLFTGGPVYKQLTQMPSADLLYSSGYTHLFIDSTWYKGLTPEAAQVLRTDPLQVIGWVGDSNNFRALLRVCAPTEGCVPYIPGIMDELAPTHLTFADSIQVTGFRGKINADHKIHIDFNVTALKSLSNDYRFSVRLTRNPDSKVFAIDGQIDPSTTQWVVGETYTGRDLIFSNVPPGKYQITIRWYDVNTPDLHALTSTNADSSVVADAVIASSFTVAY